MIFVGKVRAARLLTIDADEDRHGEVFPLAAQFEILLQETEESDRQVPTSSPLRRRIGVKILLLLPPPLDEAFHAGELLAIDIKRIISDAP